MNEIGRKPAHTVAEMASTHQHQEKNWPAIMERAMEGLSETESGPFVSFGWSALAPKWLVKANTWRNKTRSSQNPGSDHHGSFVLGFI